MKILTTLILLIPLYVECQTNNIKNSIEGYLPNETISYIKRLDSLERISRRQKRENLGVAKDTTDFINLYIERLTDSQTYLFLKSTSYSASEKLDYILIFNEYLVGLFGHQYRDYKPEKHDNLINTFHSLSQNTIAQYSLIEEMFITNETKDITFQNKYMHPVLNNTFQILEIKDNPRVQDSFKLENVSNEICAISESYFSFYKKYKSKLIDKEWRESYDWKQKNISNRHWSKCVRDSALKNL